VSGWQTARWIQRHRALTRFISRGPIRGWISRRIWTEATADPAFVEGIRQGRADYAAGRFYTWDPETEVATPSPTWPDDGPQPRDSLAPVVEMVP